MLRRFSDALAWTALLAASTATSVAAGGGGAEQLCALPTASLEAAVAQYADSAFAIDEIKKHAIATWYTDRESSDSCSSKVRDIVSHCDESSRITLVVYGLPNKDCAAGYSSGGSNKNADDYKKWVQTLADGVGQRKALYVLEPDAVGLLANGGCGASAGYAENVKAALQILSKNPNADIYLDVGYWTLFSESDAAGVAKTVKDLATGGRLKGIALNTSNYRSNKQISDLCGTFQKAYGDSSLNCIIDTSRNYNENPPSSEWCNAKFGGVGRPPSGDTGFNNLDYFIWIKPAGESDGTCDGGDHTSDAMKGPAAGSFFKELFVNLWNNGYFVKEKSYPVIDGSIRPTPAPTVPDQSTPTTQAPVSQSPTPTTTAPISQSPVSDSPVVTTPAPTETTPAPTTSTPTTFAPISQAPVPTSSAPVGQYPASTESGEIPTPTTPAPSKKKSRKHKKCDSNLEQLPEDLDAESVSGSVKTADAGALGNVTAKSVSFSTLEENSRVAPDTSNAVGASDSANTKTSESGSSGLSGAVVAAIVVAGVMGVAAAAISVRRRKEWRQRADTIRTPARTPARTPVEIVGVHVTPGGITVL